MDCYEAIQKIKLFVIENDLPKTDTGVFGIRCPYCGKLDRIRKLEPPEALSGRMSVESLTEYQTIWHGFSFSPTSCLGVCRFCQNPLELSMDSGIARPLDDPALGSG
ncbi:MAG: hypothetical protein AB7S77_14955 [Desulfatirhabdiaceae bacterium]